MTWYLQGSDSKWTWRSFYKSQHITYDSARKHLSHTFNELEPPARGNSSEVLKHDRTTTVIASSIAHGSALLPCIVKRYNAKSAWHRISRAVRESRAARCWRMSFKFAAAGVYIPKPLYMFEQRFFGFRRGAYFASQRIKGDELLTVFAELDESAKRKVVEAVRTFFWQLESARLSHGDLKASNLIWDGEHLWAIDLDAACEHYSRAAWRKANLKDRRRFLKNWASSSTLTRYFEFLNQ